MFCEPSCDDPFDFSHARTVECAHLASVRGAGQNPAVGGGREPQIGGVTAVESDEAGKQVAHHPVLARGLPPGASML